MPAFTKNIPAYTKKYASTFQHKPKNMLAYPKNMQAYTKTMPSCTKNMTAYTKKYDSIYQKLFHSICQNIHIPNPRKLSFIHQRYCEWILVWLITAWEKLPRWFTFRWVTLIWWMKMRSECCVLFQMLEISDCNLVTDVGIMDGVLSGTPKPHLKELNLGLLQTLTEPVLFRLSYFYDQLNILDLGGVSIAVTDTALQNILRHMRLLRKLNVDSCCKVSKLPNRIKSILTWAILFKLTDYGFTGVYFDIYARRHHSIRNLKGLQVLRCNGLYKLTDFTLVDAFVLTELKELYFSRCNVRFYPLN